MLTYRQILDDDLRNSRGVVARQLTGRRVGLEADDARRRVALVQPDERCADVATEVDDVGDLLGESLVLVALVNKHLPEDEHLGEVAHPECAM